MLSHIPLFPEQTSTLASEVDKLYFFVTAVTAFFALLVVICVLVAAIKYRDRTGDRPDAPILGSIPLELVWSIVPLFTSMAIFGWATVVFFGLVRVPDQTRKSIRPASDRHGGSSISTRQGNELHVPLGRPDKVILHVRGTGCTRLTIRGRSHTLLLQVASAAEYERLQVPCPRDLQLLAATQV